MLDTGDNPPHQDNMLREQRAKRTTIDKVHLRVDPGKQYWVQSPDASGLSTTITTGNPYNIHNQHFLEALADEAIDKSNSEEAATPLMITNTVEEQWTG